MEGIPEDQLRGVEAYTMFGPVDAVFVWVPGPNNLTGDYVVIVL
jgi:hypothetical protein